MISERESFTTRAAKLEAMGITPPRYVREKENLEYINDPDLLFHAQWVRDDLLVFCHMGCGRINYNECDEHCRVWKARQRLMTVIRNEIDRRNKQTKENGHNLSMTYLKTMDEIESNVRRHLERIRRLEAVAEAARKLLEKLPAHPILDASLGNSALELEEALAALEGGEQDA